MKLIGAEKQRQKHMRKGKKKEGQLKKQTENKGGKAIKKLKHKKGGKERIKRKLLHYSCVFGHYSYEAAAYN
jgi:hypothetical protein